MFLAYVKQAREGCDYTIACGETLWELEAATRSEAIDELKRMVLGEWVPEDGEYEGGCWDEWGEGDLGKVELIEVERRELLPIEIWYSKAKGKIEQGKVDVTQQAERMEYKRLKAKYDS